MLRGELIGLRARHETNVPILHAEPYEDVTTRSPADSRPWRPIPSGSGASPYAVSEPAGDAASFSVVELVGGELAGDALLWGIDSHHRSAHLGVSLRPGLAGTRARHRRRAGALPLGFAVRGLHRLQVDTLADNAAMISVAERAGFSREGVLQQAAWVDGGFVDEVILGLFATRWRRERTPEQ
ncbi:GNAT family N-acetyltransferase [Micromonospora sp. IBHARD004]|uniref:GNAT family N-acetyltransferase n=1 Tax=Micromonospora sp. IBHARD004 TaxID=3457764 RepID=UPI004058D72B